MATTKKKKPTEGAACPEGLNLPRQTGGVRRRHASGGGAEESDELERHGIVRCDARFPRQPDDLRVKESRRSRSESRDCSILLTDAQEEMEESMVEIAGVYEPWPGSARSFRVAAQA
jgi:hypothetical protein